MEKMLYKRSRKPSIVVHAIPLFQPEKMKTPRFLRPNRRSPPFVLRFLKMEEPQAQKRKTEGGQVQVPFKKIWGFGGGGPFGRKRFHLLGKPLHFQVPFVENDREKWWFPPVFSCSSYSARMGWCSNRTTCWLSQWTNITVLPIGSMIPGVLGSVFRTYIKSHTIHVWYTYPHLPFKKKQKNEGNIPVPWMVLEFQGSEISEALSSFKYADPHHFRGRIIVRQWIKGLIGAAEQKKTRFLAPEKNSEATFFFFLGGGGWVSGGGGPTKINKWQIGGFGTWFGYLGPPSWKGWWFRFDL